MAHNRKLAQLRRILRSKEDVSLLATRVAELERVHADAVCALENARLAVEDAAAELADLRVKHESGQAHVTALCQSFQRETMQDLPADVLRCIFAEATSISWNERSPQDLNVYNFERATAPYRLARVCRRWRNTALETPSMWTYVAVPRADAVTAAQIVASVECSLERSRSAPIDVVLSMVDSPPYRNILQKVAAHTHRWRTLRIRLHDNCSWDAELLACRGPMPLLERFALLDTTDNHSVPAAISDEGEFLTFAPKLEELVLTGRSTVIRIDPRAKFPVLSSVRIYNPSFMDTWRILAAAPNLQCLFLLLWVDDTGALEPARLSPTALSRLDTLGLQILPNALLQCLQRSTPPRLRSLYLVPTGVARNSDIRPWLTSISKTVTTLTLAGDLRRTDLECLKSLQNVEELIFDGRTSELLTCGTLSPGFFDSGTWQDEKVWLKLRAVVIKDNVTFDFASSHVLVAFLRRRTRDVLESGEEAGRPRRLEKFEIHHTDAPAWLLAEVQRLLEYKA